MVTEEAKEKLVDAVREILYKQYDNGEFVFDPIFIKTRLDAYGDEYLHIYVIYDGDRAELNVKKRIRLSTLLNPVLDELGIPGVPSKSFLEKSEWEEFQTGTYYETG